MSYDGLNLSNIWESRTLDTVMYRWISIWFEKMIAV